MWRDNKEVKIEGQLGGNKISGQGRTEKESMFKILRKEPE